MNNLNINNLFNNNCLNNNSKILNVLNLMEINSLNNNFNDEYIVSKIINIDKNEKKKIIDLYETKYKECLIKINDAIDMNLTDIFYKVNDSFFGYRFYNSTDCLNYIQLKLRNNKFETYICSNTNIFISWKNVIY